MPKNRRAFLKKTAFITASALTFSTRVSYAQWMTEKFPSTATPSTIIDTDKIDIKLPKIASRGSAVPITVSSELDNIQSISIWVAKNPNPLAATFKLSATLDAFVSARLKIIESSDVIVLAETSEQTYRAKAQVRVIVGGCGS